MGTYLAVALVFAFINVIAFIWLVIVGFKRSVLWGILIFLFSPLAALIFAIMYWYDAKKPFLLYLISTVAFIVPLVMMFSELDTDRMAQVGMAIESGEIQPNEAVDYYIRLGQEPAQDSLIPGSESTIMDPAIPGEPVMPIEPGTESLPVPEAINMTEEPAVAKEDPKAMAEATVEEEAAPAKDTTSTFPTPGNIKPDPLAAKKQKAESMTIRVKPESLASYKGRYFIITTKDGNQHRGLLRKVNDKTLFLTRKLYGGNFEYQVSRKKVAHADMLKEEYVKEMMDER